MYAIVYCQQYVYGFYHVSRINQYISFTIARDAYIGSHADCEMPVLSANNPFCSVVRLLTLPQQMAHGGKLMV